MGAGPRIASVACRAATRNILPETEPPDPASAPTRAAPAAGGDGKSPELIRAQARVAQLEAALRTAEARRVENRDKLVATRQELKEKLAAARASLVSSRMYGTAVQAIRSALRGDRAMDLVAGEPEIDSLSDVRALFREVARNRAEAVLAERLRRGASLEGAIAAACRDMVAVREHVAARSLGQALLRGDEANRRLGRLAMGIVATSQHLDALAWENLRALPREVWHAHAAFEFVSVAFAEAADVAAAECELILEQESQHLTASGRLGVAMAAWGAGRLDTAGALLEKLQPAGASFPDLTAEEAEQLDALRLWLASRIDGHAESRDSPTAPVIAVLDYRQPDLVRSSSNLGDHLQTLAALGTLARFQNVRFSEESALGPLMSRLQARVRGDRRIDDLVGEATVIGISRDASNVEPVPPGTWLLAFGWHMHPTFGTRVDFPYHPNVRPIFISFHVSNRHLLTRDGVDYLRRQAPIGCRDWATVHLLQSAGVEAFFSGCLTSTLDTLFEPPDPPAPDERPVARVHARMTRKELSAAPVVEVSQILTDLWRSMPDNLQDGLELLESYRRDYSRIVTSRLHCYLPATALGLEVDFRPTIAGDPRFDGLAGLSPDSPDLQAMRTGLLDKIERVTERILAGAPEDEVRAVWREACATDVEEAQRRRDAPLPELRPSFDVREACDVIRAGARHLPGDGEDPADTVQLTMSIDGNLTEELPVVLEGIVGRTRRPLHLWLLTRGVGRAYQDRLARAFPALRFTFLPCDAVDYGAILGLIRHTTISTMDRLLLPELLPEIDRILHLDVDLVVLDDIGELFDVPLDGAAVAGRSSVAPWAASGFGLVRRAETRLDAEVASELRRRMHRRLDYDFAAFNAGVLVLDLARMRADRFCEGFIPFAERYGMNDQDVLNCYAGPDRSVLPPAWNSFPTQEPVRDPKIIHWAGSAKPWDADYVAFAEEWLSLRAAHDERRAGEPYRLAVLGGSNSMIADGYVPSSVAALEAEHGRRVERLAGGSLGATTSFMGLTHLLASDVARTADLLLLEYAVTDADASDGAAEPLARCADAFEGILRISREQNPQLRIGTVLLGGRTESRRERAAAVGEAMRRLSDHYGAVVIDADAALRRREPRFFAEDRFWKDAAHPSAEGVAILGGVVAEGIRRMIAQRPGGTLPEPLRPTHLGEARYAAASTAGMARGPHEARRYENWAVDVTACRLAPGGELAFRLDGELVGLHNVGERNSSPITVDIGGRTHVLPTMPHPMMAEDRWPFLVGHIVPLLDFGLALTTDGEETIRISVSESPLEAALSVPDRRFKRPAETEAPGVALIGILYTGELTPAD